MSKRLLLVVILILFIGILLNYKGILKKFYPINYESTVVEYSRRYKLDPYMVYSIIMAESKFDSMAKSSKGAMGLMQITPQTGSYISKLLDRNSFDEDMLFYPEVNIEYGCFYLSKLFSDFKGNLDCVLAAYNGGEGNVRKWIHTDEDGNRFLIVDDIPFKETRDYIKKVKLNYKLYKFLYQN